MQFALLGGFFGGLVGTKLGFSFQLNIEHHDNNACFTEMQFSKLFAFSPVELGFGWCG